jgi:hypothetical protein
MTGVEHIKRIPTIDTTPADSTKLPRGNQGYPIAVNGDVFRVVAKTTKEAREIARANTGIEAEGAITILSLKDLTTLLNTAEHEFTWQDVLSLAELERLRSESYDTAVSNELRIFRIENIDGTFTATWDGRHVRHLPGLSPSQTLLAARNIESERANTPVEMLSVLVRRSAEEIEMQRAREFDAHVENYKQARMGYGIPLSAGQSERSEAQYKYSAAYERDTDAQFGLDRKLNRISKPVTGYPVSFTPTIDTNTLLPSIGGGNKYNPIFNLRAEQSIIRVIADTSEMAIDLVQKDLGMLGQDFRVLSLSEAAPLFSAADHRFNRDDLLRLAELEGKKVEYLGETGQIPLEFRQVEGIDGIFVSYSGRARTLSGAGNWTYVSADGTTQSYSEKLSVISVDGVTRYLSKLTLPQINAKIYRLEQDAGEKDRELTPMGVLDILASSDRWAVEKELAEEQRPRIIEESIAPNFQEHERYGYFELERRLDDYIDRVLYVKITPEEGVFDVTVDHLGTENIWNYELDQYIPEAYEERLHQSRQDTVEAVQEALSPYLEPHGLTVDEDTSNRLVAWQQAHQQLREERSLEVEEEFEGEFITSPVNGFPSMEAYEAALQQMEDNGIAKVERELKARKGELRGVLEAARVIGTDRLDTQVWAGTVARMRETIKDHDQYFRSSSYNVEMQVMRLALGTMDAIYVGYESREDPHFNISLNDYDVQPAVNAYKDGVKVLVNCEEQGLLIRPQTISAIADAVYENGHSKPRDNVRLGTLMSAIAGAALDEANAIRATNHLTYDLKSTLHNQRYYGASPPLYDDAIERYEIKKATIDLLNANNVYEIGSLTTALAEQVNVARIYEVSGQRGDQVQRVESAIEDLISAEVLDLRNRIVALPHDRPITISDATHHSLIQEMQGIIDAFSSIPFVMDAQAAGARVIRALPQAHGSDWTVASIENASGTYLVNGDGNARVTKASYNDVITAIVVDPDTLYGIDHEPVFDIQCLKPEAKIEGNKAENKRQAPNLGPEWSL